MLCVLFVVGVDIWVLFLVFVYIYIYLFICIVLLASHCDISRGWPLLEEAMTFSKRGSGAKNKKMCLIVVHLASPCDISR